MKGTLHIREHVSLCVRVCLNVCTKKEPTSKNVWLSLKKLLMLDWHIGPYIHLGVMSGLTPGPGHEKHVILGREDDKTSVVYRLETRLDENLTQGILKGR